MGLETPWTGPDRPLDLGPVHSVSFETRGRILAQVGTRPTAQLPFQPIATDGVEGIERPSSAYTWGTSPPRLARRALLQTQCQIQIQADREQDQDQNGVSDKSSTLTPRSTPVPAPTPTPTPSPAAGPAPHTPVIVPPHLVNQYHIAPHSPHRKARRADRSKGVSHLATSPLSRLPVRRPLTLSHRGTLDSTPPPVIPPCNLVEHAKQSQRQRQKNLRQPKLFLSCSTSSSAV